jgi:BASS family bile acid:Na+ symporter
LATLLQRWLLLWLCLSSLVAYLWPVVAPAGADPFTASGPVLPYLIAGLMFTVGCLLPADEVRQLARRWPTVLAGTAVQYTAMPLLGYLFAVLLAPDEETFVGVVMVGCVPGAMASNVLTLLARGNVSYSISLTTLATLLSPVVVPLALWLTLGQHAKIDPVREFRFLLLTVAGPVVLGYTVCRLWPPFARVLHMVGPVLANLAVLWIIAVVVGLNRDRLGQATGNLMVILLLINVLGYLAGYGAGLLIRLDEPMRRALTLEIGMQNAGLGATLALALFPDRPGIAIPPALYAFGCMFTGTVLAQLWARLTPPPPGPAVPPPPADPGDSRKSGGPDSPSASGT